MFPQWAKDTDPAKKLLVCPCPYRAGCGLTVDSYQAAVRASSGAAPAQNEEAKSPQKKKPALKHTLEEAEEDPGEGICTGFKDDRVSRCPRPVATEGLGAEYKLCKVSSLQAIFLKCPSIPQKYLTALH